MSDADREAVVAHLSAAAAEGRLTLDEFSERARLAYALRTAGELAGLVQDLPVRPVTRASRTASTSPTAGFGSRLPLFALIFGLVSLAGIFVMPLGTALAVAAIVLGILALGGAARGMPGGRDMAVTGLLCGLLAGAVQVPMIALIFSID